MSVISSHFFPSNQFALRSIFDIGFLVIDEFLSDPHGHRGISDFYRYEEHLSILYSSVNFF